MIRTAAERWTPRLRRLQVAAKYMPAGSKIIGVDLVPIRAIRNVVTFAQDITTQKCYAQLNKELDGRAVDLVRAAPPQPQVDKDILNTLERRSTRVPLLPADIEEVLYLPGDLQLSADGAREPLFETDGGTKESMRIPLSD